MESCKHPPPYSKVLRTSLGLPLVKGCCFLNPHCIRATKRQVYDPEFQLQNSYKSVFSSKLKHAVASQNNKRCPKRSKFSKKCVFSQKSNKIWSLLGGIQKTFLYKHVFCTSIHILNIKKLRKIIFSVRFLGGFLEIKKNT